MAQKVDETKILLEVLEANRGRVTGWAVVCREHGPMPVLVQSREAGKLAALDHRMKEHAGDGLVRVRAPKTRSSSSSSKRKRKGARRRAA